MARFVPLRIINAIVTSAYRVSGIVLSGIFLFAVHGLKAERSLKVPDPLFAREVSSVVTRGSKVVIPLNSTANYGNQVIFEIITQPLHGTLSPVKLTGDHSATVVYTHNGSREPLADRFSFRSRAHARSPSAPATCRIIIKNTPPMLIPSQVSMDFGTNRINSSKCLELILVNRGGEVAEGRLILPIGFTAPEGDVFRLGEGESRKMPIEFHPLEEKTYHSDISVIPRALSVQVPVTGLGVSRFDVREIHPNEWDLINLSSNRIRLEFNGGLGWVLPPPVTLDNRKHKRIVFLPSFKDIEETDQASNKLHALVKVSDGFSTREISLPERPRFVPLVLNSLTRSDLGTLEIGTGAEISGKLCNRSQYEKRISWSVISKCGGVPGASHVEVLKPGDSRELSFRWDPSLPGPATVEAIFREEGAEDPQKLTWIAQVVSAPQRPSVLAPAALPSSPEESPVEANQTLPPVSDSKPIPGLDCFTQKIVDSWFFRPKLEITCNDETVSSEIIVEEIFMNSLNGSLQSSRCKNLHIRRKGKVIQCEVGGLSPGWHVCRASVINKDSTVPVSSTQFAVKMPTSPSVLNRILRLMGFAAVAVLFLFLLRIRK